MAKIFNIFNKLGKKNKDTLFPKERWFVVETTHDNGNPITGSINRGYKNYKNKNLFPFCLRVMFALDESQIFENGFPSKDEFKIAVSIEDDLVDKICKLTTVHYIGRLFSSSFLDSYMYLEEPETIHNFLTKETGNPNPIREFAYEINNDPNWDMVQAYLK